MATRAIAVLSLVLLFGCDEAPNNTELCRRVYTALCQRNYDCGTIDGLNECTAHYQESCRVMVLHEGVAEPTAEEEQACVDAILEMDCEGVGEPDRLEPCFFLVAPQVDGGADGGDGDVDADGDADEEASEDLDGAAEDAQKS